MEAFNQYGYIGRDGCGEGLVDWSCCVGAVRAVRAIQQICIFRITVAIIIVTVSKTPTWRCSKSKNERVTHEYYRSI